MEYNYMKNLFQAFYDEIIEEAWYEKERPDIIENKIKNYIRHRRVIFRKFSNEDFLNMSLQLQNAFFCDCNYRQNKIGDIRSFDKLQAIAATYINNVCYKLATYNEWNDYLS